MKRALIIAAIATGILSATSAAPVAAQSEDSEGDAVHEATFAVENMTCALCPVTVKKAMERVDGVRSVEVDFEAKSATVRFDSSVTTAEAIGAASTNAGYPASSAP